ncbi:hypothetical protein LR48_Vigan04g088400 [Vigna angularis]|uniref:Pentatricopeptide repeat-containing protein n=1 Tax=Phaseolus angularis TaxID=3914 RepID=A0A0L9UD98_PHAAN|nr:hypothetical protein LR48_Vigan04g088400 [Vigna angularis]
MVAEGVVPDVSTFNILIQVLMLEDMPNHGLRPDEKTFTTFMQGFIEEGDVDGALRIKELMVELKKKMLHIKFFLSPPKYALMTLVSFNDWCLALYVVAVVMFLLGVIYFQVSKLVVNNKEFQYQSHELKVA